jgi:hypothetical protein
MSYLRDAYQGGQRAVRDLNDQKRRQDDALATLRSLPPVCRAHAAAQLLFSAAAASESAKLQIDAGELACKVESIAARFEAPVTDHTSRITP